MSVLRIVVPKCTLAASPAAPYIVSLGKYADGTDRRAEGSQTVTLRFQPDAASIISGYLW